MFSWLRPSDHYDPKQLSLKARKRLALKLDGVQISTVDRRDQLDASAALTTGKQTKTSTQLNNLGTETW